MSKKDDEINRQLIFNSGGANPEDYLTPKQLQRYQDNPDKFIDIDVDLAMNKKEETNYEQIIDDEYQFPIFSEDPTEQNRLNVRHAYKKHVNQMELSETEKNLLINNGFPSDMFTGGNAAPSPLADTALIAAPFLAKPAMIGGALTGLGKVIKKYPGKSAEVAATAFGGASEDPQDVALETTAFKADTMFGGVRPTSIKKLMSAAEEILSQSFFAQTTDGINKPFFMSKSDNVGDGVKGFSKATSPEYANIVKSGMKRMGMQDDVFDLDLYDLNSPILNEMTDPLGGAPMKSGQLRSKKLTKRNWLEYFLTPESLKGNFEALKKQGKVANTQTWEGFLKSKGLKTQAIQAHHINPLYDSVHLLDGVKWGSDEYWDIITTLIDRGARPGITEREGVTNIIKTLGASARTDTPHGVAHEFYRDIMPTFFSKAERIKIKNSHKYRIEKTKRWAGIVNRSENIVYEAHRAWEALNPEFRIDFDELVERMAKYTDQGVLEGVHENYQVPDIKNLVKQVQFDEFLDRLNIIPIQEQNKLSKKLPLVVDNQLVDDINREFLEDLAAGKTKKELVAKWGKKYNLKAIGAKQLNFFEDIRKIN